MNAEGEDNKPDGGAIIPGEEMVARIRALVPVLRERARAAEETGRIPEETIADLTDAGIFRAVMPRRFGGYQTEFRHIAHVFREMGRGCVSTSWTMGLLMFDGFQFAHFPVALQEEIWGEGRIALAGGQVMPCGSARAVDGGFVLNGRWLYASGVQHGNWMLLSSPIEGQDGPPDIRRFAVPMSAFTVLDTWHVSAMNASGSHDVELHDFFVPDHRQIPLRDLREGRGPGLAVNPEAMWRIPLLVFMSFPTVGTLLGAAEAVAEITIDMLQNKIAAYSTNRMQQQMSTRVRLSQVMMQLKATRALFDECVDDITQRCVEGAPMSRSERAEMRAAACHIARQSQYVVNELARDAGSRASTFLDQPVQRFQRDINSLATHALFDFDQLGDIHGGDLLGLEIPDGAMI
jgi:3-hydroxy-9,10-secoandrosta-1,3,5(10)-triene-9,17-dione monooxygenase